ncbi:MAG: siderophore-interacting protein [Pseudomonadota bacterium]
MHLGERVTARFDGGFSEEMIKHCADHIRDADIPVEVNGAGLRVALPGVKVELARDPSGLFIEINAADAVTLQQTREYLMNLLDHVEPNSTASMVWTGEFRRNDLPLNFYKAKVCAVRRVARKFLRVELECAGTQALKDGEGMHFSLLLSPEKQTPVWPRLDENGRTVWPNGSDSLHRAVYTFVEFDLDNQRFTFDVFEHKGGRTTEWAHNTKFGDVVGVIGPGSGGFPDGEHLLIAGDETALPAIRRILERSDSKRRGEAFVEVESDGDICKMPRPKGMELNWVIRNKGESLWDHLFCCSLPKSDSRFVWVAAEQKLVRRAKSRFRAELGLRQNEGYFAYYWVA